MNKEKTTTKTPQHLKLDFNPFEEPQLKTMLKLSEDWLTAINNNDKPYWCSLLGASGTGKTYLAKGCKQKIADYTLDLYEDKKGRNQRYTVDFMYWPEVVRRVRGGEYYLIDSYSKKDILFIDDFGAEHKTEFSIGGSNELFNKRLHKWTFLTSNLSLNDIAEQIDSRISSRIIRDGNRVAETNAMDFSLRKNLPEGV